MVHSPTKPLSLEEFLALPEGETAMELVDGQAIPKRSPKFSHSTTQKNLLFLLDRWSQNRGRVLPEWAVKLTRHGKDWVPVPDLLYVSYEHLAAEWMQDEACPVLPDLVIEIVSPGQTFGEMTEKATDYLAAGVLRVWVVDSQAKSVTVFVPESLPQTYRGNRTIADTVFPNLTLTAEQIFQSTGLVG